jgi:hypothetical protein
MELGDAAVWAGVVEIGAAAQPTTPKSKEPRQAAIMKRPLITGFQSRHVTHSTWPIDFQNHDRLQS